MQTKIFTVKYHTYISNRDFTLKMEKPDRGECSFCKVKVKDDRWSIFKVKILNHSLNSQYTSICTHAHD